MGELKRVRSAENQALKCFCAMDTMMQRETIALSDLVTLVKCAKQNECFACSKTFMEARKCELRKSLDHWTTHNMEEVDGCAYREASLL